MIWSLLGAIAAAICFGVATVMQAMSARSAPASETVDPRLLVRMMSQLPFMIGMGLDTVGFFAELAALRSLPLFVVQAIVAGNLAVTALVGARVLRLTLSGPEWAAVLAVCIGLALLGLGSGEENPAKVNLTFKAALLGSLAFVAILGVIAARFAGRMRSVALGAVAGLGFGFVAIGARVLDDFSPLDLLEDPAAYVVVGGGVIAFLVYATALQRGSVTTTTAAVVITETVVPAIVGIEELGDRTRNGFAPAAISGFIIAVVGALALSRFGEPATEEDDAEAETAPADRTTTVR